MSPQRPRSRASRRRGNTAQKSPRTLTPPTRVEAVTDSTPPAAGAVSESPPPAVTTAQRAPVNGSEPTDGDIVLIRPRDPLVLRDARPFSSEPGARAISLPWPLPRTVAGTMRTHIGNNATPPLDWTTLAGPTRARRETVSHGPLMVGQDEADGAWHAYVPGPRDVVFYRPENKKETAEDESKELKAMVLRPDSPDAAECCDMPSFSANDAEKSRGYELAFANTALRPLLVEEDVKPEVDVPSWWRLDHAVAWLNTTATEPPDSLFPYAAPDPDKPGAPQTLSGLKPLPADTRVHVSIEPGTQTNVEGALFTTEARAFRDAPVAASDSEPGEPALAMLCKVRSTIEWKRDDALVPLGGERRISSLVMNDDDALWPEVTYPSMDQFEAATGLRLLLVTPALFRYGWLPAWLGNSTIPGLKGEKVGVKLVGAAIDRRIPVSGWRVAQRQDDDNKETLSGPRRTCYAVPAGGVYFFAFDKPMERTEAEWHAIWDKLWLRPVSDHGIDCDEGFGLVLPGLWRDEHMEDAAQG